MFAVVNHQQPAFTPEVAGNFAHQPVLPTKPNGLSEGVANQPGIGERGEVDHGDPVLELAPELGGGTQGEPGLANPTHARQREQRAAGQETSDFQQFSPPPHEAAQLCRQRQARPAPPPPHR